MVFKSSIEKLPLIYLGANSLKGFEDQIIEEQPNIRFVSSLLYPERTPRKDGFDENRWICNFDSELRIKNGEVQIQGQGIGCGIDLLDRVLDDKLLPLLWTRFGAFVRWRNQSEVKRFEVLCALVKAAVRTCRDLSPSMVLFSYEPHMLPMYIFKRVCIELGVPTLTLTITPFIWRMGLKSTGLTDNVLFERSGEEEIANRQSVQRFLQEKKSSYEAAQPFYEKVRTLGSFKRLGKMLYTVKANLLRPYKLISLFSSSLNYRKLSVPFNSYSDTQYVCFFLHTQPESTTLPDGGLFTNQILAIEMLYEALKPLDINIVVREHPATFESAFDEIWRPKDYHDRILNIGEGVKLDNLSARPYQMIKNSLAVATITGTVIEESLLNGKPAIAFGEHHLSGFESESLIDDFNDHNELQSKIRRALETDKNQTILETEEFLFSLVEKTFGPETYLGNENMNFEKLREFRYEATLRALRAMTSVSQSVLPHA